jgi:REP element-mobilizing transposase RayT
VANTYTQIYIHIVFAVKGRARLIPSDKSEQLFKYITGIVQHRGHKMLAANGVPDHVHMLIGMLPSVSISDLVRDIKAGSSNFINTQNWIAGKFSWQNGFGAFSHSRREIGRIIRYIQHQQEHHRTKPFKEEFGELLAEFAVEHDDRFVFRSAEEDD